MAVSFPHVISFPTVAPSPKPSATLNSAKHALSFSKIQFRPLRKFAIVPKSTNEEVNGQTPKEGEQLSKPEEEKVVQEEKGLLSGVAEEIGEIEWPEFGKVLGTTGVVVGVIAGSSVVLLTVNAVLAEISDRVFAGRGVQDFFG